MIPLDLATLLAVLQSPYVSTLLFLQAADMATGTAVAAVNWQLNSTTSFRGATKKVATWLFVGAGFQVERAFPEMPVGHVALMLYSAHEGLSLLENGGRLGIPIPSALRNALEKLKQDNEAPPNPNRRKPKP